ncbi:maleylacetate reductase [Piscinibacter koreensis]|uniref:maleylacetate reductase n=1 Tax=Piscinibacter koreensis TaxID=2742824 RepID=A0A7Y6NRI0_9BURK|nr:maleylacetate reductase [Schlegelella koreensis]NUZ07994.1 maleylacetate reductase [Schlegelella koreensis]
MSGVRDFVFQVAMPRVVFGAGALQHVAREVDALGASRVLVLSTPGQRALGERVAALLGGRAAGLFARAEMHVPVEVANAAREAALALGADCAVAIGGGSTTGLGKAIALQTALPVIAIPTTYAGSEMTTMYGLTDAGSKTTGRDPRVLPRCVIYDPELSAGLPFATTVVSAMNAIAHAAEGLYAPDANPVVDLLAEEGIRTTASALPRLRHDARDLDARGDALIGAWLCGTVMGSITVGLHHKLCHTLGGTFGLPHAEVHSVVLPHALAYNAPAAPQAMTRIARALGTPTAPGGLFDLAARHGAPLALKSIGMQAPDLDRAADLAVKMPYPNPRPLERDKVRELLEFAFEGRRPE